MFDVKKEKPPFFYASLASGAAAPRPHLLNVNVFIFVTNVRIWIDLGDKYGTKFVLLIYYPKIC